MTMPVGSVEDYDEPEEVLSTTPTFSVHVVSSDVPPSRQVAAEHGFWRSFLITPNVNAQSATPGAVRIANRSLRRRRLLIAVYATVVNQPTIDGAVIGNSAVINSGVPMTPLLGTLSAGYIPIGQGFRWECQQELWAAYPASNTNNVLVVVCDEAYASDPQAFMHDEERGENT